MQEAGADINVVHVYNAVEKALKQFKLVNLLVPEVAFPLPSLYRRL